MKEYAQAEKAPACLKLLGLKNKIIAQVKCVVSCKKIKRNSD